MKASLTATALAIGLCPAATMAAPNVMLIIADDMGIDASNCYSLGDQQAPMPNIEAMCQSGMVFDNAYSAPVCSPTRATMLTGQYGIKTGVGGVVAIRGDNGLDPDTPSLFDALAGTGYSANLIGKWHLAGAGMGYDHPRQLGVPDYFGIFRGGVPDYFHWTAIEDEHEVKVDTYATTEFTDRAIQWTGAQDKPWFLWLAYNAPHAPFHLPPENLHSFHDLTDDHKAIDANPLPYYNAMLQALDTEIGRMLASMDAETRDNTVFIFVGDNGTPAQVARNIYGRHGAKGSIYEGGIHVPLIIWGKDVQPGRTSALVNTTDIFATVAEITGAKTDVADSISFLPVLHGGQSGRTYIYSEQFSDDPPRRADVYGWIVRQGDRKLVVLPDGTTELYDLATDPREQQNLLADGINASEQQEIDTLSEIHARLATQQAG
ncbi:sulfatase-like hydrolase/transferase [Falsirhodobacter sp. alg1]|uniref:sulfatase-like hydrolase/transferase n=1 Tax=Falsirhodobacter sp. alg1 TaxID=1472418 RepID=UPI00178CE085|nr:sulfatase-like hydrolase/transferase [Falsirhodobacter sp. alg1]